MALAGRSNWYLPAWERACASAAGFAGRRHRDVSFGLAMSKTATACSLALCAIALASAATAAAATSVRVTVTSPTHKPKVNAKWPVTVKVVNEAGKPLAATLTMRVLFGGRQIGTIDNGRTYHFTGTWREKAGNEITWPAASRGEPLTVQFVVKADGLTVRSDWAITVS